MAVSAVAAAPFFLRRPYIQLGPTASGTEISCAGTHLTMAPDQDDNTYETFCGAYTSYKAPKWTITVTIAQSFGTTGAETLIRPLCGQIVPFVVKPDQATASVDNPVMSGTCVVKHMGFIDAGPGEASEIDLELAVQGSPTKGIVDPTMSETETVAEEAPAA